MLSCGKIVAVIGVGMVSAGRMDVEEDTPLMQVDAVEKEGGMQKLQLRLRKMALAAVAQHEAGTYKVDTNQEDFLEVILQQMADIESATQKERDDAKGRMDNAAQRVTDCNDAVETSYNAVPGGINYEKDQAKDFNTSHAECRALECSFNNTMITKCYEWTKWGEGLTVPSCARVDWCGDAYQFEKHPTYTWLPALPHKEDEEDCLGIDYENDHSVGEGVTHLDDHSNHHWGVEKWASTNKATFTQHEQWCNTAVGDWNTKKTECDGSQESFEAQFCVWARKCDSTKTEGDRCYAETKATFESECEDINGPNWNSLKTWTNAAGTTLDYVQASLPFGHDGGSTVETATEGLVGTFKVQMRSIGMIKCYINILQWTAGSTSADNLEDSGDDGATSSDFKHIRNQSAVTASVTACDNLFKKTDELNDFLLTLKDLDIQKAILPVQSFVNCTDPFEYRPHDDPMWETKWYHDQTWYTCAHTEKLSKLTSCYPAASVSTS